MGETIGYIKRYNNNTTFVVEVIPDNSNGLLNKIKKELKENLATKQNNFYNSTKTQATIKLLN